MRRLACLVVAAVLALCAGSHGARAHGAVSEDTVKAVFLMRFASFVEWPPPTFADGGTPIRICVIGGALAPELERSVAGQKAGGRAFELHRLTDTKDIAACHIVYVTGPLVDETLRASHGHPVLTVTDAASTRGIIHFAVVDRRVRFYIDDARASESGLFISSRLLALAVAVRRRQ